MGKITQAELDDLRDAKKLLDALQKSVTSDASASEYANAIQTTSGAFGSSQGLDKKGDDIARFVDARTTKIKEALTRATGGVNTAVGLMATTISNYEANEKKQKAAADATPAGKSKTSGGNTQGGRG